MQKRHNCKQTKTVLGPEAIGPSSTTCGLKATATSRDYVPEPVLCEGGCNPGKRGQTYHLFIVFVQSLRSLDLEREHQGGVGKDRVFCTSKGDIKRNNKGSTLQGSVKCEGVGRSKLLCSVKLAGREGEREREYGALSKAALAKEYVDRTSAIQCGSTKRS